MQTRQEVEVNLILPSIRRQLSIELKHIGVKQAEIARRLNLTKAAVTQYIKNIRGTNITLDTITLEEIKKAAVEIKNNKDPTEVIQELLESLKSRKITCKYHRLYNKNLNECNFCFK